MSIRSELGKTWYEIRATATLHYRITCWRLAYWLMGAIPNPYRCAARLEMARALRHYCESESSAAELRAFVEAAP